MMSSATTPTVPTRPPEWNRLIADALRQYGPWQTYSRLLDARKTYPDDLSIRGYVEIVRNIIVRDFVETSRNLQAVPRLTSEFLSNFDNFNLTAQEGYLISLIDGRLDVQKLLRLSPLDAFTTLFTLARLLSQRAIAIPA